jgi:hypothetical protein
MEIANKNIDLILAENSLVSIPKAMAEGSISKTTLGTISANLAYYGYVLSERAFNVLLKMNDSEAGAWWEKVDAALKVLTGDDKKMDDFVVYKNFPQEVLDMEQSEYWTKQILMYMGFPNEFFTQEELEREELNEKLSLKVLHLADDTSLEKILKVLLIQPTSWVESQYSNVLSILNQTDLSVDLSTIKFKENMVSLLSIMMKNDIPVSLSSATDILRLAVGMSEGDISLNLNTNFKNFTRKQRKQLLLMLENTSNLEDDLTRYKGKWKRLFANLHPNDYSSLCPKVSKAYDKLYRGNLQSFNSKLDAYIKNKDVRALELLKTRPGEFMRRLNHLIKIFGSEASNKFITVLDKLTVSQLLKLIGYLSTVNERIYRTIAPKGNWTKLQVLNNTSKIDAEIQLSLLVNIENVLKVKVGEKLETKVSLDDNTKNIKLQSNDSELTPYGRGTTFDIPENMTFIRTASYWQAKRAGNVWFDNGWNFFDQNWTNMGACCWDVVDFKNKSAVFSGDPTNSKEMKGRACQMIDLYIDKLATAGVRYAVWNVLCYSNIPFEEADEVYAALQWGEEPQKGKLFEPSRCQLSFPINGKNLTKYIAYIDVVERKLVYMDANLYGHVRSAKRNGNILEEKMPAFVEYLDSLPSVYDLFSTSKVENEEDESIHVVYSDENVELKDGENAYVFKPLNEKNDFSQLNISELLT